MSINIGINGFGRIGRLVLRAGWNIPGINFHHINEINGGAQCAAHLLEFDTVQGHFKKDISYTDTKLVVEGLEIGFSDAKTPGSYDWGSANIDIVLECTGQFKTLQALNQYFEKGVKKVIVSAPIEAENALNIVYGINEDMYRPNHHQLLSAASCTTNCLAPIVKVIKDKFGIIHGSMTTIHNVTNTQVMVDAPHKDLRRARSGLNSIIPTTTGSASAITSIFPELKGRLNGHAVRVPSLNGSLTDCVFEIERDTNVEEVNACFEDASKTYLRGILGVEKRPLVSTDYIGDSRSSIIDALSTMVVNGTHLKIYSWYDNEWGYANRMIDIVKKVASSLENN